MATNHNTRFSVHEGTKIRSYTEKQNQSSVSFTTMLLFTINMFLFLVDCLVEN